MIIREAIEQSKQTAFREGYSQNADGKNVFESGHSVEPVNEVFNTTKSAGHLAKQLEGIFNNLEGDVKGNNQAVTDIQVFNGHNTQLSLYISPLIKYIPV